MKLVLRLDLDYVPWDASSHHEPATFVRLLEYGRRRGLQYHFFVSTRSLRMFPSMTDQALNEGHHVDWLARHAHVDFAATLEAFRSVGHQLQGGAGPSRVDNDQLAWWLLEEPFKPAFERLSIASAMLLASSERVVLAVSPSELGTEPEFESRWLNVIESAVQAGYELTTHRIARN